jgi:hypothetical protein
MGLAAGIGGYNVCDGQYVYQGCCDGGVGLPAESSYRLQMVGGNVLEMLAA